MKRKTVGIAFDLASSGLRRTFDALGEALDIRFEERVFGEDAGIDAWVLWETDEERPSKTEYSMAPCYTVVGRAQLAPAARSSTIEFSRHDSIPSLLRGRTIHTDEAAKCMSLPHQPKNRTVVASIGGTKIWTVQEAGAHRCHYVALPIPELEEGETLFQHFSGKRFLHLLPLLLFLRALTDDMGWEAPPLQACFMFDDPNLHWRTYGHIDFAKVLDDAATNNYHVSFATVPLDYWYVHRPTAALFAEHPGRISLLVHGNDHTSCEFAGYSNEKCDDALRQTLWRVHEYEKRCHVEISRVMAPPHGACDERALKGMARLGFEAASISKGSLQRFNKGAPWLRTLGMGPCDIVGGLPVFPRFPLSGNPFANILIASILHQPIIPMGHHEDVADGLHVLSEVSTFINSLGCVRWASMAKISRAHYARKVEGEVLYVRMHTKRVEVCVPEGASQVVVTWPRMEMKDGRGVMCRVQGTESEWVDCGFNEPFTVRSGQIVEISRDSTRVLSLDARDRGKVRLWPIVRRQMTEARDRIAPILRRIKSVGNVSA